MAVVGERLCKVGEVGSECANGGDWRGGNGECDVVVVIINK